MEDQVYQEVICVQQGFLAAALLAFEHKPIMTSKTQGGRLYFSFPATQEIREIVAKFDTGDLLVPMSFHDSVFDMCSEPYDWK